VTVGRERTEGLTEEPPSDDHRGLVVAGPRMGVIQLHVLGTEHPPHLLVQVEGTLLTQPGPELAPWLDGLVAVAEEIVSRLQPGGRGTEVGS
jgi:hypothetical protein